MNYDVVQSEGTHSEQAGNAGGTGATRHAFGAIGCRCKWIYSEKSGAKWRPDRPSANVKEVATGRERRGQPVCHDHCAMSASAKTRSVSYPQAIAHRHDRALGSGGRINSTPSRNAGPSPSLKPVKPVADRSRLRRRLATIARLQRWAGMLTVDETQGGTASLRLWCWRRGNNTKCKQTFAQFLPDEIADPGRINIPGQQFYRMRTRPFSLLVGALAARPAAEGRRTSTGINFEFFLAYGAARGPTPAFSMG